MISPPFLAVGLLMKFVAVLFVVCALALVLLILIQKGRGGGLSAAFGGGTASGLLGSKTGDFLTWFTIILVGVFLMLAVVMAKFYRPTVGEYGSEQPSRQVPADTRGSALPEGGSAPVQEVDDIIDNNAGVN